MATLREEAEHLDPLLETAESYGLELEVTATYANARADGASPEAAAQKAAAQWDLVMPS